MKSLGLALFFATSAHTALAGGEACDAAARAAAHSHGVPEQVMLAITRVESGRDAGGGLEPWPWAVHYAGQPYWYDTATEAAAFVLALEQAGETNIDLGCFQLNLHWHGAAFPSVEAMLDPVQNAEYAARFLLEKHAEKGNWVDAVAAYHSATPEHARRYVEQVETALLQLATAMPQVDPTQVVARTNAFPLLQSGASGSLASLVPRGQGMTPLFLAGP